MIFTNSFNKKDLKIGKHFQIREKPSSLWEDVFTPSTHCPAGIIHLGDSVDNASFEGSETPVKIDPNEIIKITHISKGEGGGVILGLLIKEAEYFTYLNNIKGLVALETLH